MLVKQVGITTHFSTTLRYKQDPSCYEDYCRYAGLDLTNNINKQTEMQREAVGHAGRQQNKGNH